MQDLQPKPYFEWFNSNSIAYGTIGPTNFTMIGFDTILENRLHV